MTEHFWTRKILLKTFYKEGVHIEKPAFYAFKLTSGQGLGKQVAILFIEDTQALCHAVKYMDEDSPYEYYQCSLSEPLSIEEAIAYCNEEKDGFRYADAGIDLILEALDIPHEPHRDIHEQFEFLKLFYAYAEIGLISPWSLVLGETETEQYKARLLAHGMLSDIAAIESGVPVSDLQIGIGRAASIRY